MNAQLAGEIWNAQKLDYSVLQKHLYLKFAHLDPSQKMVCALSISNLYLQS